MATQIVCIGDSITFGLNIDNNYPLQLQELLDSSHRVINLGVSGCTACSMGLFAQPYRDHPQWQEALDCVTPDLCIFLLGTNDAHKEVYNDGDFLTAFKVEYREILNVLKIKYQRLIVMIPPPCLNGNDGDHRSDILKQWSQLIPELTDGLEIDVVSLFELFGADAPVEEYYMDNVHPNEKGYKMIAEALRDTIMTTTTTIFEERPSHVLTTKARSALLSIISTLHSEAHVVDVGCGLNLSGYLETASRQRSDCNFVGIDVEFLGPSATHQLSENLQVILHDHEKECLPSTLKEISPSVAMFTFFGVDLTASLCQRALESLSEDGGMFVTWYRGGASDHLAPLVALGISMEAHPEDKELYVGRRTVA